MGAAGTMLRSTARSGEDTRRRWVYFGAVVVVGLAIILALVGVDSAEIFATLLFAVVFAATLLRGWAAGLVAAGLSTAVYAWLRRGALDEVGVAPFIVVVAGRAVSYAVVVKVGQVVSERLPPVPLPALPQGYRLSPRRRAAADGAGRSADHAPVSPPASPRGLETERQQPEPLVAAPAGPAATAIEADMGPWAEGQPLDDVLPASWSALDDEETAWEPPRESERLADVDDLASVDELPASSGRWATQAAEAPADWWADHAAGSDAAQSFPWGASQEDETSSATWGTQQVAPNVPTGWMSEDPQGGETIPVGFTGELFIPDPSEQPPDESGQGPWSVEASPEQADHRPSETPWYEIGQPSEQAPRRAAAAGATSPGPPEDYIGLADQPGAVNPETGLQTAHYLRDRLSVEREARRPGGPGYSMVMVQIPDTPFQAIPQTRRATLLRELGYQLDRAGISDEIVHLPDGVRHWFAVVLADTDKTGAYVFEQRLRSAIAGYLRHRGLQLDEVQSVSLTSPDDDETMSAIWARLAG